MCGRPRWCARSRSQRCPHQIRWRAPLQRRGQSPRSRRVNRRGHGVHTLVWLRHAAGIHAARTRRTCKIAHGQGGITGCICGLRLSASRLCDNLRLVAAMPMRAPLLTAVCATHGGQSCRSRVRRTPLPSVHSLLSNGLSHQLSLCRSPCTATACAGDPRGRNSSSMRRSCVSTRVMRHRVRADGSRRGAASVRRIRFRRRLADRERQQQAQQGDPSCNARKLPCACADFRLSGAPLRHHHHKFLRWPRSRRAS